MFLASIIAVALAAIPSALAQTDFTAAHNVTPISGTWSSGSRKVVTGSVSATQESRCRQEAHCLKGFANPANMTFTYPSVTGVSFAL